MSSWAKINLPAALVLGFDLVFDKPLYLKKMFTFRSGNSNPGSAVNFLLGLQRFDNKASSWLSLGY